MYKEASRLKVRFITAKGTLSLEQVWDLSVEELDKLAVSLEKEYNDSKGKSFLVKKTIKDKVVKLKFDIVLDILNTKVEENTIAAEKLADKQHNQRILALIEEKKEENLKGLSIEELRKQLK